MMQEIIEKFEILPFPALPLLAGILLGVIGSWLTKVSLGVISKNSRSNTLLSLRKFCAGAFSYLLPILFVFIGLKSSEGWPVWTAIFKVLLILSGSYFIIKSVSAFEEILLNQYDLGKEDNRKERKVITQLVFIKKSVIVFIVLATIGVLLLSFEEGRKYGAGLLTSAGVASLIIGFAAQKSIANFLAGIQIAFTQPIKIDDAVLVENEWGWVEEINLTYVVVRLWDWRRLILPITYFIEKPFQNWTRNKGELIGAVFLSLDYRTPISELREKLISILKDEPLWDKQVVALQVVDTKEFTITVRALMSSKTSPSTFDLRCRVREKLIEYLQNEHPQSLPNQRIIVQK